MISVRSSGTAYFARKNFEEMSMCYQRALTLDSEVFEHHSTQGTLLQDQSVEERAKYHYFVAKTYAKAGTKDRALLYIRKALEEGFKERDKFLKEPEFAALQDDPAVTDVFLFSHGWLSDVPAARAQYGLWIGAMAGCA